MLPKERQINSKQMLKDWLDYECSLYGSKYEAFSMGQILCIWESDVLCKHQVLLRKTEYYTNTNKKIRSKIYKVRLLRMQNKYCLHIPINCCDKGLRIMHVGPILMNGRVCVDKDCAFHINTALVAGGTNDDTPTLHDGVVLGIGAVVVGGVELGKNIAVGANSVVTKSFYEENIAIAGSPAKKISNNGRLAWNRKNKQ